VSGRFSIVLTDCPWRYKDRKPRGGAENHYNTEKLSWLKRLPVPSLAADDCAMFMWGTWPLLPDMLELGAAWGFKYKTLAFDWVKVVKDLSKPKMGLGHWTRANSEGCFLFTRGKPKRIHKGVSQVVLDESLDPEAVFAPLDEHSAKPPIVRDRIVQLMGDLPRIELFARDRVSGWAAWGNQVPKEDA
jgi:N6-adenosine-specific RNA methylase IME4